MVAELFGAPCHLMFAKGSKHVIWCGFISLLFLDDGIIYKVLDKHWNYMPVPRRRENMTFNLSLRGIANMRWQRTVMFLLVSLGALSGAFAQTRKPLTNTDIVNMTKQGFDVDLIVKAIQSSSTDFDVSAQALGDLKDAGVNQSVMGAMLTAQNSKPSGGTEAVHGAMLTTTDLSKPVCTGTGGCLLRESTQISLKFATELSSKTANEGDPVEFTLDEDLKVGDAVVIPKGAHAVATVSNAKKAGMIGRPGELSVQLQYLVAGDNHIHLRGTKGREGESKTGATVALTVLFGPIGLIKHGKNVDIPAGTPMTAYVGQDIWLPPLTLK